MTPGSAGDPFDRRLDPAARAPLAVAFSGGGNSLALLRRTLAWARAHQRPVLALTVDHGLNPDSGTWTARAGEQARRLGADWRGLGWDGPKPTTGIQAKARTARHALLAEAARDAGAQVILLGHTAGDIAEGELMRSTDTPGLGRLREWSPSPAWPEGRGVFLFRPLLRLSRGALRGELVDAGEPWFDDPANLDRRFARVRARQTLDVEPGAAPSLDLDPAIPALAGLVTVEATGAMLPRQALIAAPAAAGRTVLAAILLSVSAGTRPPRGPELDRLREVISHGGVATLSACRVSVDGAEVRVVRAPPRRGQAAQPAEPVVWVRDQFAAACGLTSDEATLSRQS